MHLRASKGERIAHHVSRYQPVTGLRVLDFGAGDGAVAAQMAALVGAAGHVTAADVENRLRTDAVRFLKIADGCLPLCDGSVDLVISNHVLEHVGDAAAQRRYIEECRRILTDDGILFLTLPNRWSLVEPHYRAPLLSWPPEGLRHGLLRLMLRLRLARHTPIHVQALDRYDCRPLSPRQARTLLLDVGFKPQDVTLEAIRMVLATSLGGAFGGVADTVAGPLYWLFKAFTPTIVLVARAR